jgi:hypothetical protein
VSDDIKIRWSVDTLDLNEASGEVELLRIDWDMLSPDDRRDEIRKAVGDAVLRALDVDWRIVNARLDDSNH